MAQGTFLVFDEAKKAICDGTHDLDGGVFTGRIALITTLPVVGQATPALADFTEVSGSGYTARGEALTVTWLEAAGTATFTSTQGTITWNKNASGPTNIVAGLIYDSASVGTTDAAIGFVDFTQDGGSTPISLVAGDIQWTPGANLFTLS